MMTSKYPPSKKPNLLFIVCDQQRADALSCAGGYMKTPNFDRIAAEGVRFSNCVTNSPICVSARVSLATGLYPHNTHVWDNQAFTISTEQPTWMQAVRSAGYRTSLFGKTHLHEHAAGGDLREKEAILHAIGLDDVNEIGGPRASAVTLSHMVKEWEDNGVLQAYREDIKDRFKTKPWVARPSSLPPELYMDTWVGTKAREYLEAYNREQPWCCWVSFGGPHEPWDAPEPYHSMYNRDSMPSAVPRPSWTTDPNRTPRGFLNNRVKENNAFEPGDVDDLRANYGGNVTLIDEEVGKILQAIETRGELDNTCIICTSDHGEHNGDYGLLHKMSFLDSAVRVPLIVRTPDTARGVGNVVSDSPAEWMDAGATLVELAGGTMSHQHFAKSLMPTVNDPTVEHRAEGLSEYRGEVMLMDRKWKAMLNKKGQVYVLFDRVNDPHEQTNLAGEPRLQHVEQSLRQRLLERIWSSQVHVKVGTHSIGDGAPANGSKFEAFGNEVLVSGIRKQPPTQSKL